MVVLRMPSPLSKAAIVASTVLGETQQPPDLAPQRERPSEHDPTDGPPFRARRAGRGSPALRTSGDYLIDNASLNTTIASRNGSTRQSRSLS